MALPTRPPAKASSKASAITEATTGTFEKPNDLNVPISTERVLADEHMVLMDATTASRPISKPKDRFACCHALR